MELLIFLALFALVCGGFAVLCVMMTQAAQNIRSELSRITDRVNSHLEQSARLSQEAGAGTIKAISDVYSKLGALESASQKIYDLGADIGKLQDVLRAPKARGGFGELVLGDLLRQIIPHDHFQLQFQFRSGVRVDAVIYVGDHIVSVDSKFPLENFERLVSAAADEERRRVQKDFTRDVKRHIDAIHDRYIVPDEGTLDFALMYIPAENVYYQVVVGDGREESLDLSAYALEHHVIPVSPNSFYAYLQVILLGLRGFRLDQAAREIAESLAKMRVDFKRIADDYATLGTHLNHARASYEKVQRHVDRFQGKLALAEDGNVEPASAKSTTGAAKPVIAESIQE